MRGERLGDDGQVLDEDLLLERPRRRRDDHLSSAEHGRHEIRQGFAGSGPGLDEEVVLLLEGLLHGLGHLELALAVLPPGKRLRERRPGPEDVASANHPADHGMASSLWRRTNKTPLWRRTNKTPLWRRTNKTPPTQ